VTETSQAWTYARVIDELRAFYPARFGVELSADLRFVSEAEMRNGALARTDPPKERFTIRRDRFQDVASFARTFAELESRSIFVVTFVLVLVFSGVSYFVYEVSPRTWSATGIAHIMMTHTLPEPGYEVTVVD
jgi:hypothetical protein